MAKKESPRIFITTLGDDPRFIRFDQLFDIEDIVYCIADTEEYPMIVTDYVIGSLGVRYLCRGADLEDLERIYLGIELTKAKPVFEEGDEDDLNL